jgi:O-antigen/teichoic acid export membrane protein
MGAMFWSVIQGMALQGLRLAGNLVLTRLLFPEAFGIMAIVNVLQQAMTTFSEVGIGPSIIQSKRGDDTSFIDTAWTVQVIRGLLLWVIGCAVAFPLALLYEEPLLIALIPAATFSSAIAGLASTSLFTLRRHLAIKRFASLEIGSRVCGTVAMIVLAWLLESVWALVWGGLVYATLRMIGSHLLIPGHQNRLCWNRESARELIRFGKWIFVSTALGFAATRADPLILGAYLDKATLGVFAIAVIWPRAATKLVIKMLQNVMLPLFSRLAERGHEELYRRVRQVRITMFAPLALSLCVLIGFGDYLIEILYDQRYEAAGWMVRVLAVGPLLMFAFGTGRSVLRSLGDSFRYTCIVVTSLVTKLGAMALGGYLAGIPGVIVGIGVSPIAIYPVVAWALSRHRMWMPAIDALGILFAAAVVGLFTLIRIWLPDLP